MVQKHEIADSTHRVVLSNETDLQKYSSNATQINDTSLQLLDQTVIENTSITNTIKGALKLIYGTRGGVKEGGGGVGGARPKEDKLEVF